MAVRDSLIGPQFGSDFSFLPPRWGKVRMGVLRTLLKLTGTLTSILPRRGGGYWSTRSSQLIYRSVIALAFLFGSLPNDFSILSAQDKKLDSFTISFASVSGTRAPLWI